MLIFDHTILCINISKLHSLISLQLRSINCLLTVVCGVLLFINGPFLKFIILLVTFVICCPVLSLIILLIVFSGLFILRFCYICN